MFTPKFKEKSENTINLNKISPNILNKLLNIIYHWYRNTSSNFLEDIINKNNDDFVEIYKLTHMYNIHEIQEKMLKYTYFPLSSKLLEYCNENDLENDTLFIRLIDNFYNKLWGYSSSNKQEYINLEKIDIKIHLEMLKKTFKTDRWFHRIWEQYAQFLSFEDMKIIFEEVIKNDIEWGSTTKTETKNNFFNYVDKLIKNQEDKDYIAKYTLYYTYVFKTIDKNKVETNEESDDD